jgi:hypothetical protein
MVGTGADRSGADYHLPDAPDHDTDVPRRSKVVPGRYFEALPKLVCEAWINGDIENIRYDEQTDRWSFRVALNDV